MTNDQPELDRVIGALRSAATSAELAGEDTAVEAMAATMASTPAPIRSLGSPRALRVVAVVAASLIGMGGIAAAGAATLRPSADRGNLRSDDTVSDATVRDDITATTIPTTTTILSATLADATLADDTGVVPLVDDPATEFDETQCAEGNHGATVSSIAKDTPPGPGHGDEVSIAAHSSCGKDTSDDTTDDAGVVPLVDDPATEFDETQCAEGNHGATVSSIAKDTPPGPGHGDEVSIAAHSSCGKDTSDDTTDDAGVVPLVDDPATEFDETQCAEGNHGATVSSIAKDTPPGPGHGDEVSIAAHSSCGKDTSDDTTDDAIADDGTTTTVAASDDDSPGNSDGHGNSNSHGNGNGNSGGNGNGRGNGKPGG